MNETTAAARKFADKGRAQAHSTFDKMSSAAEEATGAAQETYSSAVQGAREFNLKVIEIARTNANAAFDYAQQLMSVKSLPEFVDVANTHTRRQMEAVPEQTRELTELAQKVATDTAGPLASGFAKAANKAV